MVVFCVIFVDYIDKEQVLDQNDWSIIDWVIHLDRDWTNMHVWLYMVPS